MRRPQCSGFRLCDHQPSHSPGCRGIQVRRLVDGGSKAITALALHGGVGIVLCARLRLGSAAGKSKGDNSKEETAKCVVFFHGNEFSNRHNEFFGMPSGYT